MPTDTKIQELLVWLKPQVRKLIVAEATAAAAKEGSAEDSITRTRPINVTT